MSATDSSAQPRLSEEEIRARARELGDWFHNLDLRGVSTAPEHFLGDFPTRFWRCFAHAFPENLSGRSVLDIGCNGGFYALEMKRRGAARVLGIDEDPRYLAQARFAAEVLGAEIEYRQLSVYEVAALGERFDLVLFLGVLYHLRHPLLALDLIHEHVARDTLVLQTLERGTEEVTPVEEDYPFEAREPFERAGWPRMHFIERRFARDPTNWWAPNRACSEAMLRSAGFQIESRPVPEVYLCRRVAARGEGRSAGFVGAVPERLP